MGAESVALIWQASLASSAAALLVMAARKVLRRTFGARAAYCLWLFVPAAALAILLPEPGQVPQSVSGGQPNPIRTAATAALAAIGQAAPPGRYAMLLLMA